MGWTCLYSPPCVNIFPRLKAGEDVNWFIEIRAGADQLLNDIVPAAALWDR